MADAGCRLMTKEIARFLTDYSDRATSQSTAPAFSFLRTVRMKAPDEPEVEAPPARLSSADEHAAQIRIAVEKARLEEREIARRNLEHALAQEAVKFEERLEQERAAWTTGEAEALLAQLSDGLATLENSISDRVAHVLAPFLSEAFRQQACSDMRAVLASLHAQPNGATVRISGPSDLLHEIEKAHDTDGTALEFKPNAKSDITIVMSDTTVETRIQAWASRLNDLLKAS
jgi:hypothetical protein